MNRFLSEESIALHKEYVRLQRLKYSIIESAVPMLKDADVMDVYRMKMTSRDRRDALDLLSEIKLHELFFSSFSDRIYPRSPLVGSAYGSEADFLNFIYKRALALPHGFVLVYLVGDRIELREVIAPLDAFSSHTPTLALDVCEHVYFTDYGFDKERYLSLALPYLDLARLSVTR
jgi:superoxide dismutase